MRGASFSVGHFVQSMSLDSLRCKRPICLGVVYGFVNSFALDFLTFAGLSGIHRVCRSLGNPLFAIR
jgi:hypothetical protein